MIPPYEGPKIVNEWVKNETANSQDFQLYNLSDDLEQLINLASDYPEKVQEMIESMKEIKERVNWISSEKRKIKNFNETIVFFFISIY